MGSRSVKLSSIEQSKPPDSLRYLTATVRYRAPMTRLCPTLIAVVRPLEVVSRWCPHMLAEKHTVDLSCFEHPTPPEVDPLCPLQKGLSILCSHHVSSENVPKLARPNLGAFPVHQRALFPIKVTLSIQSARAIRRVCDDQQVFDLWQVVTFQHPVTQVVQISQRILHGRSPPCGHVALPRSTSA